MIEQQSTDYMMRRLEHLRAKISVLSREYLKEDEFDRVLEEKDRAIDDYIWRMSRFNEVAGPIIAEIQSLEAKISL